MYGGSLLFAKCAVYELLHLAYSAWHEHGELEFYVKQAILLPFVEPSPDI